MLSNVQVPARSMSSRTEHTGFIKDIDEISEIDIPPRLGYHLPEDVGMSHNCSSQNLWSSSIEYHIDALS